MSLEIRIKTSKIRGLGERLAAESGRKTDELEQQQLLLAALQFMIDSGANKVELEPEDGKNEDQLAFSVSLYGLDARLKRIKLGQSNVSVLALRTQKTVLEGGRAACELLEQSAAPIADLQIAARKTAKKYLAFKQYLDTAPVDQKPRQLQPANNVITIQPVDERRKVFTKLIRKAGTALTMAQQRANDAGVPGAISDAALASGFMQGGLELEISEEASGPEKFLLANAYRVVFED